MMATTATDVAIILYVKLIIQQSSFDVVSFYRSHNKYCG